MARAGRTRGTVPPSPPIPKVAQALAFYRWQDRFLEWSRRRCGDAFTMWVPPWGDIAVFSRADHVVEVFKQDGEYVHAGEAYAKLFARLMGPRAVFCLDGDDHLRKRKMLLPPFHGENLRRYRPVIAEIAASKVDQWEVGKRIRLADAMQQVALGVIIRVVLGVSEDARARELLALLPRIVNPGRLIQAVFAAPRLENVGPARRHTAVMQKTRELLMEEIARRRSELGFEDRADILSMLMTVSYEDGEALSDEEVVGELLTLMLAGHETGATAMTWMLEFLMRHPAALERLQAELREGSEEYLDAVVKETLRVRAPIVFIQRAVSHDVQIGEYRLPAGTGVSVAICNAHRSDANYDDSTSFRPERFLNGAALPSYAWIPFGGGRRRCIGASFAMVEMKAVLANVVSRVEMTPTRKKPEKGFTKAVTVVPKHGAEVTVTRRLLPVGAPPLILEPKTPPPRAAAPAQSSGRGEGAGRSEARVTPPVGG